MWNFNFENSMDPMVVHIYFVKIFPRAVIQHTTQVPVKAPFVHFNVHVKAGVLKRIFFGIFGFFRDQGTYVELLVSLTFGLGVGRGRAAI